MEKEGQGLSDAEIIESLMAADTTAAGNLDLEACSNPLVHFLKKMNVLWWTCIENLDGYNKKLNGLHRQFLSYLQNWKPGPNFQLSIQDISS